jgi:hypothetical protein
VSSSWPRGDLACVDSQVKSGAIEVNRSV